MVVRFYGVDHVPSQFDNNFLNLCTRFKLGITPSHCQSVISALHPLSSLGRGIATLEEAVASTVENSHEAFLKEVLQAQINNPKTYPSSCAKGSRKVPK